MDPKQNQNTRRITQLVPTPELMEDGLDSYSPRLVIEIYQDKPILNNTVARRSGIDRINHKQSQGQLNRSCKYQGSTVNFAKDT